MIGVSLGLVCQRNGRKIGRSKRMNFWHDLDHRKRRDTLQTPLCSVGVAVGNFLQDNGRHKGVTLRQDVLPPLMRDLLMPRNDQITAWSGSPIADNTGFKVYCWLHTNVSGSAGLTPRVQARLKAAARDERRL